MDGEALLDVCYCYRRTGLVAICLVLWTVSINWKGKALRDESIKIKLIIINITPLGQRRSFLILLEDKPVGPFPFFHPPLIFSPFSTHFPPQLPLGTVNPCVIQGLEITPTTLFKSPN